MTIDTAATCDVLIVGAGPVGLVLGLMLHAKGVKVQVVERQKALYPLPRAVAFDHESRRNLGVLGLTKELEPYLQDICFEGGDAGRNYLWRDADLKMIVDLFFEAPTRSGFDSASAFCQPQLESVLNQAAIDRGLPLLRGYTVTALEECGSGVEVSLDAVTMKPGTTLEERDLSPSQLDTTANGHTHLTVHASYVVGCDGANSTVRRLMGITSTDLDFSSDWLIFDILLRDEYVPPRVAKVQACQVCDPARPTTIVFGGPGRKRFEFMRLPNETKDELLDDDKIWELVGAWGFNKSNCDLERKAIYSFKARWANQFYKDRVILAGDAAHLTAPFLGQGLNSGLRDSATLAWRLPLMLSGVADAETLLRSYHQERIEHVKWLTVHAVKLGEVVCETDPVKSKQMHAELRANPPPQLYNPPLGKPGTLTDQPEAGQLALQRPLWMGQAEQPLFDAVHGYGWILLSLGDASVESQLSDASRRFFTETLQGKCVAVSTQQDYHGEYRDWFATHMGEDHVVLVRPDFYVFGHSPVTDVDGLVHELAEKMGSGVM